MTPRFERNYTAYTIPEPTPEERYAEWRARYERYLDAVIERGGTPWTDSEGERRALWSRRFTRPDPPAGIPSRTLAEIRGDHRKWLPTKTIEENAA